ELLEALIAQQVTERLRGVLELRTNVLDQLQQSRPSVLQERLKARMNPGTEVLEQKEHLVERGSPALGGSAKDAGHRPELLDQVPEPRSDVLDEGAHVLEERGHVRLELAAGEGGQDRLKGTLQGASELLRCGTSEVPQTSEGLVQQWRQPEHLEIGRASCREGVWVRVCGGAA